MDKNIKQYCKNCGKELVQTEGHRQKEFCCDNCRKAYWHKRQCNQEKICPICGTSFVAKDPRTKYCSDECKRYGLVFKNFLKSIIK